MGSAAARSLARAGLNVAGCDSRHPPHNSGSSHGESRIIRAAYFEDPIYTPLALRSFDLWRALEVESGASLLRITGGLNIGPHDGMLVSGALASAREHGIAHELLTAAETMQRYPGLHVDDEHVAVFEPTAGVLDPEACVQALLDSGARAGAKLYLDERMTAWRANNGVLEIETTRAGYQARALVLAVGAWLPEHKPQIPLEVTRQPVFWFAPFTPDLYAPDLQPHYLIEFEPGRVFYGFPDLGHGVKCALHYEGTPTKPDEVERSMRAPDLDAIRPLIARYLPEAAGPLLRHSVCLYTNTTDRHFLID